MKRCDFSPIISRATTPRSTAAEQNVSLVVGLGSYASVPAVRTAARMRIPYALLEQNAVPGRAARWLAPAAALVYSAFEGIRSHLPPGCRVRVTGNPLRRRVPRRQRGRAPFLSDRTLGKRTLIVLGGSGSAQTLNEQVPLALYKAAASLANWQVVHQAGPRDHGRTGHFYRKLGIHATVLPFIENMPLALHHQPPGGEPRRAARPSAELAASGVPAILLPFPTPPTTTSARTRRCSPLPERPKPRRARAGRQARQSPGRCHRRAGRRATVCTCACASDDATCPARRDASRRRARLAHWWKARVCRWSRRRPWAAVLAKAPVYFATWRC